LKIKKNNIWGQNFIDIAQSKGYIIKKPTAQQFKKFINFVIVGKGKNNNPESVSLSLKNLKSTKPPKWVWVEIKNHKGEPGWVYGDADFIVFELLDQYLFVNRKNLLDYIHSSIDFSLPLVQNTWEAKYKLYQRQGKLDQITQVKIKSILDIKGNYIWKKNES
jgi:hypothetical protein